MRQRIVSAARIGSFGLLTASFMTACGKDESGLADLKVTNGVQITNHEFPSVVLLMLEGRNICTGTFVNDSQIVTAAHCVYGLNTNNPDIKIVEPLQSGGRTRYIEKARALNFVKNPNYRMRDNNGVNHSDLAIINFPMGTSDHDRSIAAIPPEVDQEITIVGYGNNQNFIDQNGQQSGKGAGTKRVGTNFVRMLDDGMIVFLGLTEAIGDVERGEFSASGSGDSGGPLFVDGQLAGVTSGGGVARTESGQEISVSKYVDLNSEESQDFLRRYLRN